MTEPYDPPYRTCWGCGERVLWEEFDTKTGYCNECLIASPENQANLKADERLDDERDK